MRNILLLRSVCILISCLLLCSRVVFAYGAEIPVSGEEHGLKLGDNLDVWHDVGGAEALEGARLAYDAGKYQKLGARGSTGLEKGAFWGHFYLKNVTDNQITLHLEYVDHQLISLNAYQKSLGVGEFTSIADLSMNNPFSHRPIKHHRYVFSVVLEANDVSELYVRYGSDELGVVYPNLRIWNPEKLRYTQITEVSLIAFMVGGFLLMGVIALVSGIASGETSFYAYAVYALCKILIWTTVLGFTHQFFVTESFHWSYMSMTGAMSIFAGIWFSRMFLHTRETMRKLDYVLILLLLNAIFLFISAVFREISWAVISITFALLLYPVLPIACVVRAIQGSREALVFSIAWTFLVLGLFSQALRDLGFIQNNFINYYWPPVASFTEMLVIMVAMGLKMGRLRKQRDNVEQKYTEQLEHSKIELEVLVQDRTQELEAAKTVAEIEARTDSLTGVNNRRHFFALAEHAIDSLRDLRQPASVVMFDIDHFKSINDTYGHDVGDIALREFARVITVTIREFDIFGRLGGEEFGLLLVGEKDANMKTADRLRMEVAQIRIPLDDGDIRFTVSAGICHVRGGVGLSRLLKQADEALYAAKLDGRNQVVVAKD